MAEAGGRAGLPDRMQSFSWDDHQVSLGVCRNNLLHAVPLIPFVNNQDGNGDFEPVTGLVDAYNLLLSGAIDDMQSVANAFLALYGLLGTTGSDIREATRTQNLSFSEGGGATLGEPVEFSGTPVFTRICPTTTLILPQRFSPFPTFSLTESFGSTCPGWMTRRRSCGAKKRKKLKKFRRL